MYDPKEARKTRRIARIAAKLASFLEARKARLEDALKDQKVRKGTGGYTPRKLSKNRKELSVTARVFYAIQQSKTPLSPLEITHILAAEPISPQPSNKHVNAAIHKLMERGAIQRVGYAAYAKHGRTAPVWSKRIALNYGAKL